MSVDLVVDNSLSSTAQAVKDQQGNASQLYLSTGNVGVGNNDPQRKLDVFGNNDVTGALAAANAAGSQRVNIWVDDTNGRGRVDSGGSGQLTLRINDGGGSVSLGGGLTVSGSSVKLPGLANLPSSGTVDLVVDSSGTVSTQTSSKRFKEKIGRFRDDFSKILSLEPVSYIDKRSGDSHIGYTAEDLHDKELGSLVAYDEEGKPLSVHYKLLPVYLVEVLKEQQELLGQLARRLADFEGKVGSLEGSTAG